ncbi:hypothetical protein [Halalkalibacter nanhaiisediminis]|uniref:Uncharacterized protein n=1 Tax=Halalkalibacter nanhaiisediminis TaxID=688079 RepID=A0A562QQC1_9BACI|nr:hypothetical protein [Halalkalibacter nanhaiisediminis]TWI58934.1 hypothetical protein IQ10_00642 [Halalkalibacter nanhaiisediminis]
MQASWMNKIQFFFTPSHKKPVDDHILRDRTTRNLIEDTEELLVRMVKNAPSYNKKRTIKRKQKEWFIKVKVSHTFITVTMMDLKHSTSPINKRMVITCYRRYMKAIDGVGVCKEASIRYIKDGRAQTRSIRESPLLHSLFYRIHHLDLAYSNERVGSAQTSKELLANQQQLLQTTSANDVTLFVEEARRYIDTVKQFTVDPAISNRLQRIIAQAHKLQDDFQLLDFEERHTVRRMFREDIPTLIHTFLSLSMKHQLEQKENVYVALSKMELTLIDYVEQLEKLRVERMDYLLKLQALRYDRQL